MNDEDTYVAMIQQRRAQRVAESMRQCVITTHDQYGADGTFLTGLCVTVNGQKSRELTCDQPMAVAFHSGSPQEVVGRVIDMPHGCRVRRGEDCTVKCLIIEVVGCSQLLYVERLMLEDEAGDRIPAWRLRRVRNTGAATSRLGKGVSPYTSALGGRTPRR